MKHILVTGGAGFIGSHVVVELVAAGYQPIIIDNFSNSDAHAIERLEKLLGSPVPHYESDFQNVDTLRKIFEHDGVDGIVHLAAVKYVGESVSQPLRYYDNNVSGFVTLLEVALDADVRQIVFSSSAAVYGNPPHPKVTEDVACEPMSPYGWSKRMDEIILRDTCTANPELYGVGLRYFNVIGSHESAKIGEVPSQEPKNLAQVMMRAAGGEIETLVINGTDYPTPDGTCLRDYIHVVDLAKAHVAALKLLESGPKPNYDVFNIGTGKPTSVMELLTSFEKVNGVKVPHQLGPRRPGDPVGYYAVPDKANRELGWKAVYTIDDALRDAWRWQQSLDQVRK